MKYQKKIIFYITAAFFLLSAMTFFSCASLFKSESAPVKEHELSGEQWHDWNNVKTEWMRKEYWSILKKYRIEMSCGDCEYAYITVRLHIDNNGRVVEIDIIKEQICRGGAVEELKDAFLKYFREAVMPESLRNMTIETMLGTGLRC